MSRTKNPNAVMLGSLGGAAGRGKAKARIISAEQKLAATTARWRGKVRKSSLVLSKHPVGKYWTIEAVKNGHPIKRIYWCKKRAAITQFLRTVNSRWFTGE